MEHDYDLTLKIGSFLDLHLLLPLLNFIEEHNLYPREEILQTKIELLSKTNMVDYAIDTYKELTGEEDPPEAMIKARDNLLEKFNEAHLKSKKFTDLLSDEHVMRSLTDSFTASYLEEHHKITKEDIEGLYALAKFQFECGKYEDTMDYLHHYRLLVDKDKNKERALQSLWGKLAAEILMSNWDEAERDIALIRESIEEVSLSQNPLKQLQQRAWLIHWALFVYFHLPDGPVKLLETFFSQNNEGMGSRYLKAIELQAPWILRYFSIATILSSKHRHKELVKLIEQESYAYSDPITDFIRFLYIKCDFDSAEKVLVDCDRVLSHDYFICGTDELKEKNIKGKFLQAARLAVSEEFCKIHSTIDIGMMAKKLQKSNEESERWIVDLIRSSKLDAKIDISKNQVVVIHQPPNFYQQILEKTKTLSLKAEEFQPSNIHN